VGAQPQPAAAPRVAVAEPQLAAVRARRYVVQHFGEGDAPAAADLRARAGVDAALARRHAGDRVRDAIGGKALEAVPQEDVEARLGRDVAELEADAMRMQVDALALV